MPRDVHPALKSIVVGTVPVDVAVRSQQSRRRRVQAALGLTRPSPQTWQQQAEDIIRAWDPDVLVTVGPWWHEEFRPLFGVRPTVHLWEEDLSRMAELAPQSRRARALRRVETFAASRAVPQPAAVVVISEREAAGATRRFPRADIVHLPFTLAADEWPTSPSVSEGDHVAVLSVLSEARNAEGLAAVLARLVEAGRQDVPFRLYSDRGLHPVLQPFLRLPWIQYVDPAPDPLEIYRGARVAFVPARRVTGLKTTILQGWSCGCPVVSYASAAETVGPTFHDAVASGEDDERVAARLVQVWDDAGTRRELVVRGRRALRDGFDDKHVHHEFVALLRGTAQALRQ